MSYVRAGEKFGQSGRSIGYVHRSIIHVIMPYRANLSIHTCAKALPAAAATGPCRRPHWQRPPPAPSGRGPAGQGQQELEPRHRCCWVSSHAARGLWFWCWGGNGGVSRKHHMVVQQRRMTHPNVDESSKNINAHDRAKSTRGPPNRSSRGCPFIQAKPIDRIPTHAKIHGVDAASSSSCCLACLAHSSCWLKPAPSELRRRTDPGQVS